MKRILKISGISLLIILLTLAILPLVFKGKLIEIVKNEANKQLDAQLEFSGIGISFIRNFPNVTISLKDLRITGKNEFEGDTLIFVEKIAATANIKSFFGHSGYEISKISINKGKLRIIVTKDGKTNWDIVKSGESTTEANTTTSDFKLSLQSVTIDNTDLSYEAAASNMSAISKGIKLNLSGDMTAGNTQMKVKLSSKSLSFIMNKIPYLSNVKANMDVILDADFKNNKYTFSDNIFHINEIEAELNGWFAIPNEPGLKMDIRLNTPKTQFKDILSLIPAIYANDFKDVKASGEVLLEAYAKGLIQGDTLPSFHVKIGIADAQFQYPSLPKSVNNINLDVRVTNPGGSTDNTVVDIQTLHFEMTGNPFDAELHLKTPVSDPDFNLSAIGHLDLGMIKEVYPLKNIELNGKLDANIRFSARMSAIEKGEYERVDASGNLHLKEMLFKGMMKDDILINKASLVFSPHYLDLNDCDIKIGKSNLAVVGKLENFLPYALKDEPLRGTLSLTSNYLRLNDFISDVPKEVDVASKDTAHAGIFVIPQNLDFNLSGNFKQVEFDQLDMTNVYGKIIVKKGKAEIENLKLNALEGELLVNGYYDSAVNPGQPETSLDLDIKNASFTKTFESFETVRKFAPVFEVINGRFSTSFQMTTPLDTNFMPLLTDLTASGLLQSNNLEVQNVEVLNLIASTLKVESLKNLNIKDLKLPFSIHNGRVMTKPFDVHFSEGKMNLSGSTGLDQTIDYLAIVNLSEKLTKGYVNSVNLKIGGTFTKPKISIDVADVAGKAINKLIGSVLGGNESGTATEKITQEVGKQADAIRRQAKTAGEQLVAEAEKQGQRLIDEANKTKNPLVKTAAVIAAQAAAGKLKEEAGKQSQKLLDEAEKQIVDLENKVK